MVLQQLHRENSKTITYHLVTLKKTLTIGSDPASDLHIQGQTTVCQLHASLKFDGHHVKLVGRSTKFATAVQMTRPLLLDAHRFLMIEVGRICLHFSFVTPTIPSCGCFGFLRKRK
jgi:hypothetical protein